MTKVLAEKKTVGLANHTVLLSRTGEEWPIEDSAAPISDAKGATLAWVLVFHDATNTRLAQQSLKIYYANLEKIVADRTLALEQTVSELQAFPIPFRTISAPLCARCKVFPRRSPKTTAPSSTTGANIISTGLRRAVRLDRLMWTCFPTRASRGTKIRWRPA